MKKLLTACLLLIASAAAAQTSGPASLDAILTRVRTQLEAQIERVKRAREVADARVTLAGVRVEEQLQRAEEDLTVQNERLRLLQEQLLDQLKDADQAYLAFRNEWRPAMTQAVRNIRSQISATNSLIAQIQRAQVTSSTPTGGNVTGGCSGCPYEDRGVPDAVGDLAPPSLAELEAELSRLESQSAVSSSTRSSTALLPALPGPYCARCGN